LKAALTPPTSEEWDKDKGSSSDLSDVELDDDEGGEIEPDHYYEDGRIPVFKPVSSDVARRWTELITDFSVIEYGAVS